MARLRSGIDEEEEVEAAAAAAEGPEVGAQSRSAVAGMRWRRRGNGNGYGSGNVDAVNNVSSAAGGAAAAADLAAAPTAYSSQPLPPEATAPQHVTLSRSASSPERHVPERRSPGALPEGVMSTPPSASAGVWRRSKTSVIVRAASPLANNSPPRPTGFFGACMPRRRQGTPLLPTLMFEELGIEEIDGEAAAAANEEVPLTELTPVHTSAGEGAHRALSPRR